MGLESWQLRPTRPFFISTLRQGSDVQIRVHVSKSFLLVLFASQPTGSPGRRHGDDHCYSLSRASISAKLSPVSLWILLTQDLAEFSTLGVPKGSCSSPCRLRAALRMLDQL